MAGPVFTLGVTPVPFDVNPRKTTFFSDLLDSTMQMNQWRCALEWPMERKKVNDNRNTCLEATQPFLSCTTLFIYHRSTTVHTCISLALILKLSLEQVKRLQVA